MKITIEAEEILNKIKDSLYYQKPLLITRLGEGEIRMFIRNGQDDWIIKNMFGYVPNSDHMDEIRNNLEISLINSDITGIPTYKKLKNENEILKSDLNPVYKKTFEIFREIFEKNNLEESNFDFCDVNIHTIFNGKSLFKELLYNLENLTIITCRDVDDKLKKVFNIKNIEVYKIPPEYRFEDDPSKIKWNFYPDVHSEIKSKMLNQDNRGKLCLYGAGVAGKDLGYYFKKSGGVAFDIGSIFDLWIGKHTRGRGKGRNKYFKSILG
jgi:hypothetical protein